MAVFRGIGFENHWARSYHSPSDKKPGSGSVIQLVAEVLCSSGYSKCDLGTSSLSVIWECKRKAAPSTPPPPAPTLNHNPGAGAQEYRFGQVLQGILMHPKVCEPLLYSSLAAKAIWVCILVGRFPKHFTLGWLLVLATQAKWMGQIKLDFH